MNRQSPPPTADLAQLALTAIDLCTDDAPLPPPDWSPEALKQAVKTIRQTPGSTDRRFVALAAALDLSDGELLALALVAAAEADPLVARAIAHAQAPLGGSRPLTGLLARALGGIGMTVMGLAAGRAAQSGLFRIGDEPTALPERTLSVPLPILAACTGIDADLPGAQLIDPDLFAIPARIGKDITRWAHSLSEGHLSGVAIRSHSRAEGIAIAAGIALGLDRRVARIDAVLPEALGPWLVATGALPLFAPEIGTGDRWRVPGLRGVTVPWLVATAPEAILEADTPFADWIVPVPTASERRMLWLAAGVPDRIAERAALSFRQGAGRINEVGRVAKGLALSDGSDRPDWTHVAQAVGRGSAPLDVHARISRADVGEDALVLPEPLTRAMRDLVARAQVRDRLDAGLGPAITARYRPGVRALFVGESGTGKTLAAHWFAARLGLPLYRVDLGVLTSKWIGETEKNISAVLGAAEDADAVLFFDEADALFAARTDVSDANDRHANAQTNHLLQRIEEFDGIAILAANSRTRFDPAFTRRLDAILDFPLPEGAARAALWRAHLGTGHALSDTEIDHLAVAVDLAGGHIRNIVLSAAAKACGSGAPPGLVAITGAIAEEYAKLGKQAPPLGP